MEVKVRPITAKEPKPKLLDKVGLSGLVKRLKVRNEKLRQYRF